jgi:agmatine/peptidylarginine deiminase
MSLDEFIVKDGDVFMVEVKFGDKWPRDAGNTIEKDWRNFEVGDMIDVFYNNEWKIGRIVRVFKEKLKIHIINESYKNDLIISKD